MNSGNGIGAVDLEIAKTAMQTISQKQKQKYQVYEDSDRLKIAKYSLLHGPRATARKFKNRVPKAERKYCANICYQVQKAEGK